MADSKTPRIRSFHLNLPNMQSLPPQVSIDDRPQVNTAVDGPAPELLGPTKDKRPSIPRIR